MGNIKRELNNYCPRCYEYMQYGVKQCPHCGCPMNWGILPQEKAQPAVHTSQQQADRSKRAGGGIVCVHCGSIITPVKSKFGCGFFSLLGIVYLIYYAFKRADICPKCKSNAYK